MHAEVREAQGRLQNLLQVRRRSRLRHIAEPLPNALRGNVQLRMHHERGHCLPVLLPVVQLQVRLHEGRLLHHLHDGRQDLLRDGAGLLRLHRSVLQVRLRVLRLLWHRSSLLRRLLSRPTLLKRQILARPDICRTGGIPTL